jgi:hypothetical protein
MMQQYGWSTGWMWAPAVVSVLVIWLLVTMIGKVSKK